MRPARVMRQKRRATVELVLAVVAAAGAAWSWFGARSIVTVAPILPDEPQTTSVALSPPMRDLLLAPWPACRRRHRRRCSAGRSAVARLPPPTLSQ